MALKSTDQKVDALTHDFLSGGGEMGELIRSFDWSKTTLGPIEKWPRSLRTCVQIMLTSRQPIWIGWGRDLIKLYNDPYKQIVRGKHPWALGKPASVVWSDIWKDIEQMLRKVMDENEGTYVEEQLLIMERNGYPEETYYTFSYTPVAGDDGITAGMICFNTDDTDRIISERQLRTLTGLGKKLNDLKTAQHVFHETINVIHNNPHDFPFVLLYEVQDGILRPLEATAETAFEKRFNALSDSPHKLLELCRHTHRSGKPQVIKKLRSTIGEMPSGAWALPPDDAIVLSIAQRGSTDAYAYLIVGVNPFRLLDEKYLSFFQLVADQVAASLTNIYAIEEERKRLEALAEIDRAKTVFFSNISHEFRTPLTLMLGSLEEFLQKPDDRVGPADKSTLQTTHRNALRLLRLVNNLLDFSRLEAGKEKPNLHRVDIAAFTRELASNFSSLVETAGLRYDVAIEDFHRPAFIDKVMWEKIVLNLISNAFKYTLQGTITVSLVQRESHFEFSVRDTGVGIPKEELPKMFQRFHRVQNSVGRTFEGTGIGLSLVNELVKLHKGNISVTSEKGVGSLFVVEMPFGEMEFQSDHTPSPSGDTASLVSGFVDEAFSLVKDAVKHGDTHPMEAPAGANKVLVVDDNPDMRSYIKTLLQAKFTVVTATNGSEAIEKVRVEKPDIVVSDIMMPVKDGVQMMKELKADPMTKMLPVILLSARAGEEAKIEGYETGADDYLVKPFSAKELNARISSQVKLANMRREVEGNLRNILLQAPVAMTLLRGPSLIVEIVNGMALEIWGRKLEDVLGKPIAQALPEVEEQGVVQILQKVYDTGDAFYASEFPIVLNRFGQTQTLFINFIYTPLRNDDNQITGLIGVGVDVTEQVNSRKAIENATAALNNAIELGELGTWEIDLPTQQTTYAERVAEWWGLSPDGAPLEQVLNCIHADDRSRVNEAIGRAIASKGTYNAEYRLVNSVTGDERYIQAIGNVQYDDQNNPQKLAGIVRDITLFKLAHRELERQVRERTKELELLNEDLKRSNSELSQFAYVASHDLQEPLRKIQTFSDLARSNVSKPQPLRDYLDKIDNSAARMSSLIRDLLLFSKIAQDGRETIIVDLNEVLQDVMSDFELLIAERQAKIESVKLPSVPGNKWHYHQLFSNLIGNSIKFSQGEPRIRIEHHVIRNADITETKSLPEKLYHQLLFRDNGIGFEQAYADQIFNLFTRLHNRSEYKGTGIGLALCKKIVENQNGSIRAESSPGQGATFIILLPGVE